LLYIAQINYNIIITICNKKCNKRPQKIDECNKILYNNNQKEEKIISTTNNISKCFH